MVRILVTSMLCLMAVTAADSAPAAASPATWPTERFVAWQPEWGSRTIEAAGLSVHVEPKKCGDGRPISESCYSSTDGYTVVTVAAPGMRPVTIEGGAGLGSYIGIGKLGPGDTRPSLVLITEGGGSAGCVQIDFAVPDSASYRSVRLSVTAVDHGTLCHVYPSTLAWPRDLTGHGRPEFLMIDDSFYCGFLASCAGTWYPPRVVAFDGSRGIDVSSDPALAPLFRADIKEARDACEHGVRSPQGACAGFAADAARLGELDEAMAVIRAQVRRGCRVPVSERVPVTGECYSINQIPAGFEAELTAALRKTGYIH